MPSIFDGDAAVREGEAVNHNACHVEGSLGFRRAECGGDVAGVPGERLGRVAMEQRLLHLPCHSLVVALGVVDRVPLGVGDQVPVGGVDRVPLGVVDLVGGDIIASGLRLGEAKALARDRKRLSGYDALRLVERRKREKT